MIDFFIHHDFIRDVVYIAFAVYYNRYMYMFLRSKFGLGAFNAIAFTFLTWLLFVGIFEEALSSRMAELDIPSLNPVHSI